MKVIGQEFGRVAILFPIEEIRPRSGIPITDLLQTIQERYSFVKLPDLNTLMVDVQREGLVFEAGTLWYDDQKIVVNEFSIFRDGMNVSCFDTEYADAFFDDLFKMGRERFSIREFVRPPQKIYRSRIVVEFEKSINGLIGGFTALSRTIQATYNQFTGRDEPVSLNRLDFCMDPTNIGGIVPIPFVLERRIGIPHDSERYISEAPVSSELHIQMLQAIENAIP